MYDQEQEHWDYEMGAQSELRNAFDRSRFEADIQNDTKKIDDLVAQGKHVVVEAHPICCRSTDAYIGRAVCIIGVFDTRDEAMVMFNQASEDISDCDLDVWVSPTPPIPPLPKKELEAIFLSDDNIPF